MNKTKILRNLYVFALMIAGLASCTDAIYEEHQDVREVLAWAKDDVKTFTVNIPDSRAYDVYIALRHHSALKGPSILVQVSMTAPDGKITNRNVPVHIRDERGDLLGSAAGDLTDTEYVIMPDYTFPGEGNYTFKISQIDEGDKIAGMIEVGLKVAPVKKAE